MTSVEVAGTSLWHVVDGSGPPILVCHGGLGLDHVLYRATLGRLAADHRVIWYDHRGNGRSGRPPLDSITIEQLADDAAALLEHLGVGPAVVLGHSYGGFVALELALRHPGSVAGLVLVATGPGQLGTDEVEGEDGEGPPLPEPLAAAFASAPTTDGEMRTTFEAVLPHYVHRADPQVLLDALQDAVVSVDAMGRGFEVLAGWSAVDRLARIAVPTLVVGGRRDPLTSWPQQVRIAKRVPGATLVLLDEASHLVWLDDPTGFWAAVDAFLAAHADRS